MAKVAAAQKWIGAQARRRVGWPDSYGRRKFGTFTYGDDQGAYGIWQQRRSKKGRYQVLMPYYWPRNPNTEEQQNQRTKFRNAIEAWQSLTTEQKEQYNEVAKGKKRHGYGFFLSEFLKTPLP